MEQQLRSIIKVRDELEEVRGIIGFVGRTFAAVELDYADRSAAQAVLEQQAGRLLSCSDTLGVVVNQAGSAPS